MAMLYTHSIGNHLYNTIVVFKMRDSEPSSVRYSRVCNVLRLWRIWLIPTYRVYRLYDKVYNKCCRELLTLGAHAHSEGYSSCRVCVCVCVCVCVYV